MSMRPYVRLRADTILELTDGRAECLRVTGNTKTRSFAPSAGGSDGGTISTVWHQSRMGSRAGATGGGLRCKTLGMQL